MDQDCDGRSLLSTRQRWVSKHRDSLTEAARLDCDDAGEGSSGEPDTDCDDSDATINPGATEIVADEIDQDCDTDETCFRDTDNDGFEPLTALTVNSNDLDCDDLGEGAQSEPATVR